VRRIILVLAVATVLALLSGTAVAQSSTAQPVDPPQEVAQLRQQYEGLTPEQVKAAGYEQMHECVPNPEGAGAMGTHFINHEYLEAQFPKGEMDPTTPPRNLARSEQQGSRNRVGSQGCRAGADGVIRTNHPDSARTSRGRGSSLHAAHLLRA
jgi:hypothetical protein